MYEERVSHLRTNNCYYAHLSIYKFALAWCKDAVVLDAGCGTGYGAAYLADHDAKEVIGIDLDRVAIAEAQKYFQKKNLRYEFQDLSDIKAFSNHSFDVIFSSNALEHVPEVERFFQNARSLLKPAGVLIVAVPIARSDIDVSAELSNPYHLNIWSPRRWFEMHQMYFNDVDCFAQVIGKPGFKGPMLNDSQQATLSESDFLFPQREIEELYNPSNGAIFVARSPRSQSAPGSFTSDHSVTRGMQPAWLHPFSWGYYGIRHTLRYEGVGGLFSKIFQRAQKIFR